MLSTTLAFSLCFHMSTFDMGSISAALSCLVYPPRESSGEERGLISRTAAGNRAYIRQRMIFHAFPPRSLQGAVRWETLGNEVVFAYRALQPPKTLMETKVYGTFCGTVFKGLRFLLSTRLANDAFSKGSTFETVSVFISLRFHQRFWSF